MSPVSPETVYNFLEELMQDGDIYHGNIPTEIVKNFNLPPEMALEVYEKWLNLDHS